MRKLMLGLAFAVSLGSISIVTPASVTNFGGFQNRSNGSDLLAIGVARPPRIDQPQFLAIGVARPPRADKSQILAIGVARPPRLA